MYSLSTHHNFFYIYSNIICQNARYGLYILRFGINSMKLNVAGLALGLSAAFTSGSTHIMIQINGNYNLSYTFSSMATTNSDNYVQQATQPNGHTYTDYRILTIYTYIYAHTRTLEQPHTYIHIATKLLASKQA